MKKQFETKEAFDKWLSDFADKKFEEKKDSLSLIEQLSFRLTDEDYINGLIADGYTDLNNLVADGHDYQIGEYTNNGWIFEDEADFFCDDSVVKVKR